MNETNTFGWRLKNSWFMIIAFIPLIQFIPFFIMNGRIPKKKWLLMGFANLLMIIISIFLLFISPVIGTANVRSPQNYPHEPAGRPSFPKGQPNILSYDFDVYDPDHLESEEYKRYQEDMDAFEQTEEYKEYERAVEEFESTEEYKEYLKACDDYYNSDEYQEYEQALESRYSRRGALSSAGIWLFFITWLMFALLGFFVERYSFLRNLAINQNRGSVYGQLTGRADMTPAMAGAAMPGPGQMPQPNPNDVTRQFVDSLQPAQPYGQQYEPYSNIPMQDLQSYSYEMPGPQYGDNAVEYTANVPIVINVNTATEAELMALPGMKTIDAKKIIDYRNTYGAFTTTDQFFASFGVKPHIMVKMQSMITLGGEATAERAPQNAVRRFDL